MSEHDEIEQARRQAEPVRWTVQALLDQLPNVHPFWMRDALPHFGGDRSELETRLLALRDQQRTELARTYMGLVLFFVGHPDGKRTLIAALRSDAQKVRMLALDTFRVLRWDDVGSGARPGKLDITDVEVFEAIDWMLEDPTSPEGKLGLEYAIKLAFEPARAMLAGLLRHPEAAVRDKVLETFLARGCDDGALDVLADELLGRRAEQRAADKAWRDARLLDTRWLFHGAKATQDSKFRERAGALALRLLREALAAKEPSSRFDPPTAWLTGRTLVQVPVIAKTHGAAPVLASMVAHQQLSGTLRAQAAIAYKELTGQIPEGARRAVREAVEREECNHADKLLERLHAVDLLDVDTALAAVGTSWWFEATPLLRKWHDGRENEHIARGLVARLSTLAQQAGTGRGSLAGAVDVLRAIPRSAETNDAAIAALRAALATARQRQDNPRASREVARLLISLGDTAAAELADVEPWDATWAHWQAQLWTAADVAQLLRGAGLAEELGAADVAGVDLAAMRPDTALLALLDKGGKRYAFHSIRDDGFAPPHHDLFAALVRTLRPEVRIEAVSQQLDSKMTELSVSDRAQVFTRTPGGDVPIDQAGLADVPVYSTEGTVATVTFVHANEVRRFVVRPGGSWMDVGGVLRGFDAFMGSIGRPERAYHLETQSWATHEFGLFVCADPARFGPANERLRLPLDAKAPASI
ncbi:MAG TPA: hypothetical protein VFO94_17515 [Gammaproteobacteria bacterium]|nr:hypothetical protein [Gammaproteobacteria bacterium]